MTQQQWDEMIQMYRNKLLAINILHDIEPAQGKQILSQLDNLYGEIRILYGDICKKVKDTERWIYRVENKGRVAGRNDADRKAAGVIAVENFVLQTGETVNLYEIEGELINKEQDLESLLDIVKSKNSLVITMSGLLKIESNFAGR